ncbi:hypothetical protein AM7_031 [Lactococcus phage AM7]|uniref:Uncharacterized protein n=2 Tax=Teubervirus AM6 TaxID=2845190 RepID=A0A1W6JIE5_9CAUD|nr:hypothetical protein H1N71_gp31 [Lactococcus phage AM6]ARM65978.1 hypothetical protein AM6_031 [Lactococcus phage AM6]ARM66068.1 hypothetical protein AM7_031 [Lactococcus phage AM7]
MEYAEVITWKNGNTDRYDYESLEEAQEKYQRDIPTLTNSTSITIESRLNKNEKWKPLFRFNRRNQEEYNKCLTQNI